MYFKAQAGHLCLRLYVLWSATSQNLNENSVGHHNISTWKQTELIIAFGQGNPIWKQMQELKWIILLLGFGTTSRLCTAYTKGTVWLNVSPTSVPSLWCRKRPETALNNELCAKRFVPKSTITWHCCSEKLTVGAVLRDGAWESEKSSFSKYCLPKGIKTKNLCQYIKEDNEGFRDFCFSFFLFKYGPMFRNNHEACIHR